MNRHNLAILTVDEVEQVAGGDGVISGNSMTTAVVGGNVVTYGYTSQPFYGGLYGGLYGLGAAALPYGYGLGLGYGYGLGLGLPYARGFYRYW